MVRSGLEFSSPHSNYKLIDHSDRKNYTYWSSRCKKGELISCHYLIVRGNKNYKAMSMIYLSDFGDGWAPTVLNSREELSFILKGFKNIGPSHRKHYIGGSTDHGPNKKITYSKYYNNGSGNKK